MPIRISKIISIPCVLFALSGSINAFAVVAASRTPAQPDGTGQSLTDNDATIINLNPDHVQVDALSGYSSITSIKVDSGAGEIKGYAEYTLNQNRTYSTVADVGGSGAFGSLSFTSSLQGPPNANFANSPINVDVEFSFNGQFVVNYGHPTLALGGVLSAAILPSNPLAGSLVQSTLTFTSTAENSAVHPVDTATVSSQTPLFGGGGASPYGGATFDILSAQMNDLEAVMHLTFAMNSGDQLILLGSILGVADAEPDPLNNDADEVNGIGVLAASGAVDFSHTARLKVFLPEGYSFTGSDPLLNSAVFASPVPASPALLQIMAGLAFLGGHLMRKRKCAVKLR